MLVTIWTMKPFKALFARAGFYFTWRMDFQIPLFALEVLKVILLSPNQCQWMRCLNSTSLGGTAHFIAGDYLYLHPRRGHQERYWRLCRNAN
ncbi:hypothetical protein ACLK1T_17645 [Escherichia coli]